MKVLLVEDDRKIATAIKRGLEGQGFTVEASLDGAEGLWLATEGSYDLIILDIMLPGRNGYQVCADLRKAGDWTPILMLTAKDRDLDEAEALETGADDYLTKPFSFPVLVARIKARRLKAENRLMVEMSGVSGAQVLGDRHQLARAIANLSNNAERHASTAVKFTLTELDGEAVFTVEDDGPGIPPGHTDVIFERFVRADDARGPSTGGSGLGLAITREIVERHGGTVEVDTAHTSGARFVLTIPTR